MTGSSSTFSPEIEVMTSVRDDVTSGSLSATSALIKYAVIIIGC